MENSASNNKWGGNRPGTGRKRGWKAPHTLQAETLRKELIKSVLKEYKPIIAALIDQAKRGNLQAIREVFDRVWGKGTQPVNFELDGLKEIQDVLQKLAANNSNPR